MRNRQNIGKMVVPIVQLARRIQVKLELFYPKIMRKLSTKKEIIRHQLVSIFVFIVYFNIIIIKNIIIILFINAVDFYFHIFIFWINERYLNRSILLAARDYEIVRNQVELGEIIGEGQFGNVHKGSYKGRDGQTIAVAVKTCKVDADHATSEKFLEEACTKN